MQTYNVVNNCVFNSDKFTIWFFFAMQQNVYFCTVWGLWRYNHRETDPLYQALGACSAADDNSPQKQALDTNKENTKDKKKSKK